MGFDNRIPANRIQTVAAADSYRAADVLSEFACGFQGIDPGRQQSHDGVALIVGKAGPLGDFPKSAAAPQAVVGLPVDDADLYAGCLDRLVHL